MSTSGCVLWQLHSKNKALMQRDRPREPSCLPAGPCPAALPPLPMRLLLYFYLCKLQMFVLSFSHEAVRSMFHTQMRWVGLQSIILPPCPVPSCPTLNGQTANSPRGFPSVQKIYFLPSPEFSSSPVQSSTKPKPHLTLHFVAP